MLDNITSVIKNSRKEDPEGCVFISIMAAIVAIAVFATVWQIVAAWIGG